MLQKRVGSYIRKMYHYDFCDNEFVLRYEICMICMFTCSRGISQNSPIKNCTQEKLHAYTSVWVLFRNLNRVVESCM